MLRVRKDNVWYEFDAEFTVNGNVVVVYTQEGDKQKIIATFEEPEICLSKPPGPAGASSST